MRIKYIALGTNDEKKNALEKNVKFYMEKLGWDTDQGVRGKGAEIDIILYHNLYPSPFFVECKAVKDPSGSNQVHNFRSKVQMWDKPSNLIKKGWFISLSGYRGGVIDNFKDDYVVKIFDGMQYLDFLLENHFIIPLDEIKNKYNIQNADISQIWFLFREEHMYWIISLGEGIILEFASKIRKNISNEEKEWIYKNFQESDINESILIAPLDEWEFCKFFLNNPKFKQNEICKKLNCTSISIKTLLNQYISENIIINIKDEYFHVISFESARTLIQKFSKIKFEQGKFEFQGDFKKIIDFGKSAFYKENLKDFTQIIIKHFGFSDIKEKNKKIIEKVLQISPFSISYCFGKTDRIWEKDNHKIEELLSILSHFLLNDIMNYRFDLFYEIDKGNKMIFIDPSIEIKFGLQHELFLQLGKVPSKILITKIKKHSKGIVFRGDLLQAGDDIINLNVGNIFVNLGLWDEAIDCFKKNMKLYPKHYGAYASVTNLIMCYMNQSNPSFEKILNLYNTYSEEIFNLSKDNVKCQNEEQNKKMESEIIKLKDLFINNFENALSNHVKNNMVKLLKANNFIESNKIFEEHKLIALKPLFYEIYNLYAYNFAYLKNYSKAHQVIDKILEDIPNRNELESQEKYKILSFYTDSKGEFFQYEGNFPNAKKYYRKSLDFGEFEISDETRLKMRLCDDMISDVKIIKEEINKMKEKKINK